MSFYHLRKHFSLECLSAINVGRQILVLKEGWDWKKIYRLLAHDKSRCVFTRESVDKRWRECDILYIKSSGHHNRGAPQKRFKDLLEASLNACHIDPCLWSDLATDCEVWQHTIHWAVSYFKNTHWGNHSTQLQPDLQLQLLQPILRATHRLCQPPASLQAM